MFLYEFQKYLRYCTVNQTNYMRFKILLPLFTVLFTTAVFAQDKTYTFSEIQSRNSLMQWEKGEIIGSRTVHFSPSEISLNIDKDYRLSIISKTSLPDNGVIYLCQDDKANPVTVMLFDNIKMYLYNKTKRFLINFNSASIMASAE